MKEIDELYGKSSDDSSAPSRDKGSKRQAAAAEQDQQVDFDSGFDHGFESMATFNGRSVGNDMQGAAASSSVGGAAEASQSAAAR